MDTLAVDQNSVNLKPQNSRVETTSEREKNIRDTAQQFESLLVHSMLKSMRRTTMDEGGSNEKSIYNDMMDKHLASVISKSGKFGVAQAIERQLSDSVNNKSLSSEEIATHSAQVKATESGSELTRPVSVALNLSEKSHIPGLSTRDLERFRESAGLSQSSNPQILSNQKRAFIDPLMPHANRNANRLGTSPNAILAIAALESGWGQKVASDENGKPSYNLFGIKSFGKDVESVNILTTEYIDGKPEKIVDRFRVFKNPADAVDGFADFILENPRYKKALEHASDPTRFLEELQRAGYATDPKYADKAISILQQIENSREALK